MTTLEEAAFPNYKPRIEARIKVLEKQLEDLVMQANVQASALQGAINEFKAILAPLPDDLPTAPLAPLPIDPPEVK